MKKVIFLISLLAFVMVSCSTQKRAIDYVEARNYFHSTDAPLPEQLKITTEEEFNKHFLLRLLWERGEVTPIDFTRSFVIAKVLPETYKKIDLIPLELRKTGNNELELTYQLKTGKMRSFSTQPMFILIVDKRYKDFTIKEVVR